MKRVGILFVILALLPVNSDASGEAGSESPFAFGAGARELALGGADLTHLGSGYAPFWNPSVLARAQRYSVTGFHTRLFDSDVSYQYLGFTAPTIDFGVFGVGLFRLGVDNIERRDANNFLLGTFSDERYSINLAYGRSFSGIDFGVALTGERHSLDTYTATTSPGVNLAVSKITYPKSTYIREIAFALIGKNLLRPSSRLGGSSTEYPYRGDIGATVVMSPGSPESHLFSLHGRISKVDGVSSTIGVGLEYTYQAHLSIRAGLDKSNPSVGVGIEYRNFGFDYSVVDRDLGALHVLNFSTSFGKSIKSRREERWKRQETQFEGLMTQRLLSKNHSLIDKLVLRGTKSMEEKAPTLALQSFDKALFIARTGQLDTIAVLKLVSEARAEIAEIEKSMQFQEFLDSAQSKIGNGDYFFAKYFADLALEIKPESIPAMLILTTANDSLSQGEESREIIRNHVARADSLLTYGRTEEAMRIIEAVRNSTPFSQPVELVYKRVRFELLRDRAQKFYELKQYQLTLEILDSASFYFPDHDWCLQLERKAKAALAPVARLEAKLSAGRSDPISGELLRRAEKQYEKGQKFFADGNLQEAISAWETVTSIDENYGSVRDYLVRAYKFVGIEFYGSGKLSEAIEIWKRAQKLDGSDRELMNYINRAESERQLLQELTYGS